MGRVFDCRRSGTIIWRADRVPSSFRRRTVRRAMIWVADWRRAGAEMIWVADWPDDTICRQLAGQRPSGLGGAPDKFSTPSAVRDRSACVLGGEMGRSRRGSDLATWRCGGCGETARRAAKRRVAPRVERYTRARGTLHARVRTRGTLHARRTHVARVERST
jgi:hypothetical protein